jgi:hypothetical protein
VNDAFIGRHPLSLTRADGWPRTILVTLFTLSFGLSAASSACAQSPPATSASAPPTAESTPDDGQSSDAPPKLPDPSEEVPVPSPPNLDSDPAVKLLMQALGRENAQVQVYGWIENSFTGNTNGTPKNLSNVTVFPNNLANQWQGNQYYVILENAIEEGDELNFGFRFDTLFGNDWQFTKDVGLFDNTFRTNSFAGLDFPQIYGSAHLPFLTENGIDIKGGRFYAPSGYESPMAIYRPAFSVSNIFNYTVFTYVGELTTIHVNDRFDLQVGAVNGTNRWIDTSYVWNALLGAFWTSPSGKTTILDNFRVGPDQFPYFARADAQFPLPGFPPPPFRAGQRNVGYTHRPRYYHSLTLTHEWTERLREVCESDFVIDVDSPGFGPNGTAKTASISGYVHWLLYDLNEQALGYWRFELFRDPNGAVTGMADNYFETTLGVRYKAKPWLWIRPEARYDWVQFNHPYSDGTRSSQLTLAVDVTVLW